VLVSGVAGVVITDNGRPVAVIGFIVRGGKIVEIDAIADPERVGRLTADVLD
jgi:RNA polymerase sigma-70 factor (ECF subfamily)